MILSAASSKPTSCEKSSSGPTSILDRAVEELARGPRPAPVQARRRPDLERLFVLAADPRGRLPKRVEQPFAARRALSQLDHSPRRAGGVAQRPQPDPRRLPARLSTYALELVRDRGQPPQARIASPRSRSSSARSSQSPARVPGGARAGRRPARVARLGAAPLSCARRSASAAARSPSSRVTARRVARRQRLVHLARR